MNVKTIDEMIKQNTYNIINSVTNTVIIVLFLNEGSPIIPDSDVAFPENYFPEKFRKLSEEPEKYVWLVNYNVSLVKHGKQQVFLFYTFI